MNPIQLESQNPLVRKLSSRKLISGGHGSKCDVAPFADQSISESKGIAPHVLYTVRDQIREYGINFQYLERGSRASHADPMNMLFTTNRGIEERAAVGDEIEESGIQRRIPVGRIRDNTANTNSCRRTGAVFQVLEQIPRQCVWVGHVPQIFDEKCGCNAETNERPTQSGRRMEWQ